jgi:hypothetical protein
MSDRHIIAYGAIGFLVCWAAYGIFAVLRRRLIERRRALGRSDYSRPE